jgi:predicted lipoprotein with Yx(FWY)xxD motif
MRTTIVARLGAVAVAGLLLAACSGLGSGSGGGAADDYGTDNGAGGGNANDAAKGSGGGYGGGSGGENSGGDANKGGAIKVTDSDHGQILTDAEGRALYAFAKDVGGQSSCNGDCEENWPPLLAQGKPSGSAGIDSSLLKTVSREDGSKQVVIGKWPLYYFAGDNAPDDTQGQGVNDVWWLVGPDGKLVKS